MDVETSSRPCGRNPGHWPLERRERVKPGRRCSKGRSQHDGLHNPSLWHGRKTNRPRSIRRTAVYGPVRTVVWEGKSREAPPYPDCGRIYPRLTGQGPQASSTSFSAPLGRVCPFCPSLPVDTDRVRRSRILLVLLKSVQQMMSCEAQKLIVWKDRQINSLKREVPRHE